MTIEQKTFTPQKTTISKNGAEAFSVAELKPLTPEQLSVIDNLKGSVNKLIVQCLVEAREQEKPVTMQELVDGYISTFKNHKPIICPEEIDEENIQKGIRNSIARSLRPTFEPVDLFIVNHTDIGKKGGSFYFLKTREELPTQEELDQSHTLRDLSAAVDEPNLDLLRSRMYTAMKKDPTIQGHYLPNWDDSKRLFFKQDAFEKLIVAVKATKTVAKNGRNSNKDSTLNHQDDDEPQDLERNPFRHEFHARSILGRTEQIREDLIVCSTDTILSHLLIGAMEELGHDAKELLENLLPRYSHFKIQLSSVTREPVEQFFDMIVKRVEELWAKHPNATSSERDRRTINYCLRLRQKYTLQNIVDIMYQHFSLPRPSTSAPAL